jgi:ATP-dependent Lon protease
MPYNLRKRRGKNISDDSSGGEEEGSGSGGEEDNSGADNSGADNSVITADESSLVIYNPEYFQKRDAEFIYRVVGKKVKRYKTLIGKVRSVQSSGYVRLQDILDSNVSDEKKVDLVVAFDRMKEIPYYDPEFLALNTYIKNGLKERETENNAFTDGPMDLLEKIRKAEICEENRGKLINKFHSVQKCETSDKHELMAYIDYGLRIKNVSYRSPDAIKYSDETAHVFAKSIRDSLDEHIYGQVTAKEEIIDSVIARENNPTIGNITVFKGPPGVGKTHTARKLAELLGYKFYHISIGGVTSAERITGSLSVNVGSRPGEIFTAISEMGCDNGIIFLDEFDKIFSGDGYGMESLRNVFLNMLDPTQNCHFRDNYLYDLNIDLSKIWFIISVNELGCIGEAVKDRLRPIVHFDKYTKADRFEILRLHIIPRTIKMYRFKTSFRITPDAYEYLVGGSSGIRELKSMCETLFKKISTLVLTFGSEYRPSYYVEIMKDGETFVIDGKTVKALLPVKSEEKFMSFYS